MTIRVEEVEEVGGGLGVLMALKSLRKLYVVLLGGGAEHLSIIIAWAAFLKEKKMYSLRRILLRSLERSHGVYIAPNAVLEPGVCFPHPVGIVIGDGVRIASGSVVYQNVTLGGARIGDAQMGKYPQIGRNCTLFAGATVLGAVIVGDGCIVGANAVVTKTIPANHVAVGIPARFHKIKDARYE